MSLTRGLVLPFATIDSGSGFLPSWCQAIIQTSGDVLAIEP